MSHEWRVFRAAVSAGLIEVHRKGDGHSYMCRLDGQILGKEKHGDFENGPQHLRDEHAEIWFWFDLFMRSTGDWIPSSLRVEASYVES